MTVPFWCLLVVIFLPYVMSALSVRHRKAQFGVYDNAFSRIQGNQLIGQGALVWAAHQNALEARAAFAAAVIVAHLANADATWSAVLAVGFLGLRILHAVFHVNGMATARSAVFGLSMACVLGLFLLGAVV